MRPSALPAFLLTLLVALPVAANPGPGATLVISRPATCPVPARARCASFDEALAHPALHRRLRDATVIRQTADIPPFIAVETASGAEVMRWTGWHDGATLSTIVGRVVAASGNLAAADLALHAGDADTLARHWALALLEFGDAARGRALLESMQQSDSVENRQLASMWLERFRSAGSAGLPCDEIFQDLATNGVSARVRFEAYMGVGRSLMIRGGDEAAVGAFEKALGSAPDEASRRTAMKARDVAYAAAPLLGGGSGAVVSGRRSIRLRRLPRGTASVDYRMDGRHVATATSDPFVASIDFGRIPTRRVLEVTSRDRAGNVLDRSQIVFNERSEAFAVDLIEPKGNDLAGVVTVSAAARIPQGRRLEMLTIEWNGSVVARFTRPPYRTTVTIEPGEAGVLRAALRLDDGSEVEDARLINSYSYESDAHLVEIPVYFDRTPPRPGELALRENGMVRPVEQIIPPSDAPLEVALLLDSSGSMQAHMLDLQEAAARFVEEQLGPRDRVMLVPFASQANVLVQPTTDKAAIVDAILSLEARGATALHDALIATLLQLQTTGTRRALIVFSDGLDGVSEFSARDVAEVARRSGVPIYVLAFVHPSPPRPVLPGTRMRPDRAADAITDARTRLTALSRTTGGLAFELRSLDRLARHWSAIAEDLATQSLVIYRAAPQGDEWRTLDLDLPGARSIRAPAGVWVTVPATAQ